MEASSFTALIGDVVESRSHRNQGVMLERLRRALDEVNRQVPAEQRLEPTIGDEFQGLYRDVADALKANLLLKMRCKGELDVRVGIGQGKVALLVSDLAPKGQSGQAWWFARDAIDEVKKLVKGWPEGLRSRFRSADASVEGLVNAFLVCQDQITSRMDETDARITLGLLRGVKQQDLAEELGITQSSISARQRQNGPAALAKAYGSLREGPGSG